MKSYIKILILVGCMGSAFLAGHKATKIGTRVQCTDCFMGGVEYAVSGLKPYIEHLEDMLDNKFKQDPSEERNNKEIEINL